MERKIERGNWRGKEVKLLKMLVYQNAFKMKRQREGEKKY